MKQILKKRKLQIDNTVILDIRWMILQGDGKPSDAVVLIFFLIMWFFSYGKQFKVGKTDSNKCLWCKTECDD